MAGRRRIKIFRLICSVLALVWATGCIGDIFGVNCTSELRPNLVLEVRDSLTGAPFAWGATAIAQHEDGRLTELSPVDSLHLAGNWSREQGGSYQLTVRKPGYRLVQRTVQVDENRCHVETLTVAVSLASNPEAAEQPPLWFQTAEHVGGSNASAGISTQGDTLFIAGRAYAPCSDLVAKAARYGSELHVQFQPREWSYEECHGSQWLQQFSAAYRLPAGATHLYITNGFAQPTLLFSGTVGIDLSSSNVAPGDHE